MTTPIGAFLRAQGLEPLTWDEALRRAEQKLTTPQADAFRRLHRAFVAYPTPHTVRGFYDFAAAHDLLAELAGFRFERLERLAAALEATPRGARVLDLGAGGGWLARRLRDSFAARVAVSDLSSEALRRLVEQGFEAFDSEAATEPFDLILCADSLGEIHADEDEWLADPAHAELPEYADELEARYGFAAKLAPLRPHLAPGGAVLLLEPVALPHFWHGAARGLRAAGWDAEVLGPDPAWGLRLRPA